MLRHYKSGVRGPPWYFVSVAFKGLKLTVGVGSQIGARLRVEYSS